jgi:hypothetical protein
MHERDNESNESIIARFHKHEKHDFPVVEPEKPNPEAGKYKAQIEEVVSSLNNIKLNFDTKEQKELLKEKVALAKKKILDVLFAVSDYIEGIFKLDREKIDKEKHQKDYLESLQAADNRRKQLHTALISELQSTIRYISFNFADINEKALDDWMEKEEEAGRKILDVDRSQTKFPKNIIFSSELDFRNRKQVTQWAMALEKELAEIKRELSS